MKWQRGQLEIMLALGAALVIAMAVAYIMYQRVEAVTKERDAAQTALAAQKVNEKVVVKYVDKIVEVQKRVPLTAAALERLCRSASVPGAGSPDAAAAPDAGVRSNIFSALATDIGSCQANAAQLQALEEVLRPQVNQ